MAAIIHPLRSTGGFNIYALRDENTLSGFSANKHSSSCAQSTLKIHPSSSDFHGSKIFHYPIHSQHWLLMMCREIGKGRGTHRLQECFRQYRKSHFHGLLTIDVRRNILVNTISMSATPSDWRKYFGFKTSLFCVAAESHPKTRLLPTSTVHNNFIRRRQVQQLPVPLAVANQCQKRRTNLK